MRFLYACTSRASGVAVSIADKVRFISTVAFAFTVDLLLIGILLFWISEFLFIYL